MKINMLLFRLINVRSYNGNLKKSCNHEQNYTIDNFKIEDKDYNRFFLNKCIELKYWKLMFNLSIQLRNQKT